MVPIFYTITTDIVKGIQLKFWKYNIKDLSYLYCVLNKQYKTIILNLDLD